MKEQHNELQEAFLRFRKLNFSGIFPKLSHGEAVTLKVIAECEACPECCKEGQAGVSISLIVNKLCVAAPAVSRTLNSLEEQGLVERNVNKSDRRNTLVKLTELGRITQKEADERMQNYWERIMDRVGNDEVQKVIESVNRIYEIAKEELEILKREEK